MPLVTIIYDNRLSNATLCLDPDTATTESKEGIEREGERRERERGRERYGVGRGRSMLVVVRIVSTRCVWGESRTTEESQSVRSSVGRGEAVQCCTCWTVLDSAVEYGVAGTA